MERVQFFDGTTWYLVLLPKNWTWDLLGDLMFSRGLDVAHWKLVTRIALFDGDISGKVGDVYMKVG